MAVPKDSVVPRDSVVTERLVELLVADAQPVRRLRPPGLRAAVWLLAVAAIAGVAIMLFADRATFLHRIRDPKLCVELAATLLTGIAAIVAAFHLSLPDRSSFWALLPLPTLALWISSSGYSCWRHVVQHGPDGWALGEGGDCFRFILGVSIPLGFCLMLPLRRARPLAPLPVAAVGGLGVASIAAFILQFFHPFDVTFMDLGAHLAAVLSVVVLASLFGRWARR